MTPGSVLDGELREGRRRGVQRRARELEEALQPVAESRELRLAAVVGTSADDRLARMKEEIQHGLSRGCEVARERDHVLERRVRRPQPPDAREAELPQDALGRVRPWSARVEILQRPRQTPIE